MEWNTDNRNLMVDTPYSSFVEGNSACVIDTQSPRSCAGRGIPLEQPLIPIVKIGWKRAVVVMTIVIKYVSLLVHKAHMNGRNNLLCELLSKKCRVCLYVNQKSKEQEMPCTRDRAKELSKEFINYENTFLGKDYWFRVASI